MHASALLLVALKPLWRIAPAGCLSASLVWLSSAEPRLLGADLQFASPWLQRDILAGLRAAFPLLHFKPSEMQLLRQRRCRACVVVTHRMRRIPRLSLGERAARLGVAADQRGEPRQLASQIPSGRRKLQSVSLPGACL